MVLPSGTYFSQWAEGNVNDETDTMSNPLASIVERGHNLHV